jgi:hypothetical protein
MVTTFGWFSAEAARASRTKRSTASWSWPGGAGGFLEEPAMAVAARQGGDGASLAGQTAGHYQVLSLLGSGGMGDVYLALDTRLGRRVALKLLPDDLAGDEGRARRFEQEARAASALNHPNVVTIHEIGDRPAPNEAAMVPSPAPAVVVECWCGLVENVGRRPGCAAGAVSGAQAAGGGSGASRLPAARPEGVRGLASHLTITSLAR